MDGSTSAQNRKEWAEMFNDPENLKCVAIVGVLVSLSSERSVTWGHYDYVHMFSSFLSSLAS